MQGRRRLGDQEDFLRRWRLSRDLTTREDVQVSSSRARGRP